MMDELLYTQEDIDEWIRTCEELQERNRELEYDLAEINQKIENGSLIELPCKLGDTVYWVWEEYTKQKRYLSIYEWKVDRFELREKEWSVRGVGEQLQDGSYEFFWCHSSKFGIWWFLTREEAEKRLKELQE